METEHTETVVEKAVAYVKDFLGIPPGDRTPDVVAKPEYTDTAPEPTIEGAMRLEPYDTTKSVAELNIERRENSDTAFDEHTEAAEQIDRPRNSAQEALDEIRNASLREDIADKNPSHNDQPDIKSAAETMNDNKKLPTESEMQKAIERARDANSEE
jgi:hypothetical protein